MSTPMEDLTESLRSQIPNLRQISNNSINGSFNAAYGERIALERISGRATDLIVAIQSLG